MDEIQKLITMIDTKIYSYEVAVKTINPIYSVSKGVAEILTEEFIRDLKEIRAVLLQEKITA